MGVIYLSELEAFNSLDYLGKLKFWEDKLISFGNTTKQVTNSVNITIEPKNVQELVSYNRWVINHFQNHFRNNLTQSNLRDSGGRYKSIEEYLLYFSNRFKGQKYEDKLEFIEDQIRNINAFILNKTKPETPLSRIHSLVNYDLEDDIYYSKENIVVLRGIAEVLDAIKYRVYLRRQLRILNLSKPPHKGYVFKLTKERIRKLYENLVANSFIHKNTDLDFFTSVFNNECMPSEDKILWVDCASNHEVNKKTLIELADELIHSTTRQQNLFLIDFFKLYGPKENGLPGEMAFIEITNETLKGARRLSKKTPNLKPPTSNDNKPRSKHPNILRKELLVSICRKG